MNQIVESPSLVESVSVVGAPKETIIQKFFSFKGRLGRENFFKRYLISFVASYAGMLVLMIFAALLGALISAVLPRRAAGAAIGILIFIIFSVVIIGMLVMMCSLGARRLHDLGYSGWWILGGFAYAIIATVLAMVPTIASLSVIARGPQFAFDTLSSFAFMVNLMLLLMLPLYVGMFALLFWPGQTSENQYGLPARERKVHFLSSWEQIKKEFFSFSGRLNRKWFIGMYLAVSFFGAYLGAGMLIYGIIGIGAAFIGSSILTGVVSGLTFLIGVAGVVASCYSYISLLGRRVQDMGYSRWVGISFFFLQVIFGLISIGLLGLLVSELAPVYRFHRNGIDIDNIVGIFKGLSVISSLSFLGMILMMALPGTKGENQYGPNPVEVGLLPGEQVESEEV